MTLRTVMRALIFAIFCLLVGTAAAQQPALPAAFEAYACRFQRSANAVEISAILQGADGRPLADGALSVSAEQRGQMRELALDLAPLGQRPPLRLVIVFDLTDTVPLAELTAALEADLLANLQPQDEVSLITFSEIISPATPFVRDKDAFIRDYLTGLTLSGGDNRLYDATAQALDSFPFDVGTRRAVLVITDSGRRQLEQTPAETIINRAQRDNTQIYAIGFVSRDRPDVDELTRISAETGGYFWLYGERNNTRASIAQAVGAYLGDFVRTLNSETKITISAQDLRPDSNNRVVLALTALLEDDTEITEQVTCPVETLHHDITFITNAGGAPVTGRIDIGVNVQSDLGSDQIRVIFRVNGEIVQTSTAPTYAFDAASLSPGFYTIEAEIWDAANNTLAKTANPLRLYVQQALQLTVEQPATGGIDLVVRGNAALALPDVEFIALPAGQPAQAQVLGTAPYVDGAATLHVDDLAAALRAVFPDAITGGAYQISASIPNATAGDPMLGGSNPLPVTLTAPAATPTPTPPPAPLVPERNLRLEYGVPLSVFLALLLLNILLLRAIHRRRIRRIIDYPDNIDLAPQLMTLTVLRDGMRQAHALTRKTVTIGRGSSNDINISDDQNISRQHGVIMWRRGDWYYSNRKSNLVTRIDGRVRRGFVLYRLEGVVELQIGDVIMVFHSSAQQDIADFIKTDL